MKKNIVNEIEMQIIEEAISIIRKFPDDVNVIREQSRIIAEASTKLLEKIFLTEKK